MNEQPQIIDTGKAEEVMNDLFARLENENDSRVIIVPDVSEGGYGLITTELIYKNINNIVFGNVLSISAPDKPESKKSIALFTLPADPNTIQFTLYEGQLVEAEEGGYRFIPNED